MEHGLGGSSSSSGAGANGAPASANGGGLLALENAAPEQIRLAVCYEFQTVYIGADKPSVRVGRDEDNEIVIRATKAVTCEILWEEHRPQPHLTVAVRQSEIPVFLVRAGTKEGLLLKHGHTYAPDADIRQTYGANEGVETSLNLGDVLYFKDKHAQEHVLKVKEVREQLSREEKILLILENKKQLNKFLEPRLQMLNAQIYSVTRAVEHKVRPEEIAQEQKLAKDIKELRQRIDNHQKKFTEKEEAARQVERGEYEHLVDHQEFFHKRAEAAEHAILRKTYDTNALEQPKAHPEPSEHFKIAAHGRWEDPEAKAKREQQEKEKKDEEARQLERQQAHEEELRLRDDEDDDFQAEMDAANQREFAQGRGGAAAASSSGNKRSRAQLDRGLSRAQQDADERDRKADEKAARDAAREQQIYDEEDDLLAG